jgi:hypothetical protein
VATTTKTIRRIQGERQPLLKLSELSPTERLEVLNVRTRDLKPLLRHMPVQKLGDMRIITGPSEHTVNYRDDLRSGTRALCVYRLLWHHPITPGKTIVSGHWLALTTEGVWIYRDAEGHGTEETGYTTSSSFSVVPKRDLLDMFQCDRGARLVREICQNLLQYAQNVVRSHEQRAEETRRVFQNARDLTRDRVNFDT